jgi:hypothetical protein
MHGAVFAPCGRNKGDSSEYAEFNNSCTDKKKLEQQLDIQIKDPTEWINFTENDYDKLEQSDKNLFEQE